MFIYKCFVENEHLLAGQLAWQESTSKERSQYDLKALDNLGTKRQRCD